jgi:3-phosphoinositide dependent protein kinase-1
VAHQKEDWPIHKGVCQVLRKGTVSKENCLRQRRESLLLELTQFKKTVYFQRMKAVRKLGDGNFSEIHLVNDSLTNKNYALKTIEKTNLLRIRKEKDVFMEKHCLLKLKDCPSTIDLIETHKDDFNLYMLLEAVEGGELFDHCTIWGFIPRALIQFYFALIVRAVQEIHDKGIVHRDLKPENILVTGEDRRLKLVDFGTAWDLIEPEKKGAGNGSTRRKVYDHFIGTPNYMSMESIHNRGSYKATDVYSMGCILYQ